MARFRPVALLVLLALPATRCETTVDITFPAAPAVQPFADNHDWLILRDYVFVIEDANTAVRIPAGFVTDFASIPQALWSFGFSPNGRYSRAALIHDYLYWTQSCTREQADNLFLIAMKQSNVSPIDQRVVYLGVRAGGSFPWDANREEKVSGLPRIVPKPYWSRIPSDASWADYRKTLAAARVADPAFTTPAPYCRLGDTVDAPAKGQRPDSP